jgi:hypothetical protein
MPPRELPPRRLALPPGGDPPCDDGRLPARDAMPLESPVPRWPALEPFGAAPAELGALERPPGPAGDDDEEEEEAPSAVVAFTEPACPIVGEAGWTAPVRAPVATPSR